MAASALLATACGQSGAGGSAAEAKTAAARVLDVGGVTIGMPIAEARRMLEAKGYRMSTTNGPGWNAALAMEIEKAKGNPYPPGGDRSGITALYADKDGEQIGMTSITPTPGGGAVDVVSYKASLSGRSKEEMRASVRAKYGKPTMDDGKGFMLWCAVGDTCLPDKNRQPRLRYQDGAEAELSLDPGLDHVEAVRNRMKAAVVAKVGKPKTSF